MKKILFLAGTAILLAISCQKTEVQNMSLDQIGFNAKMGKLTKAPNASKSDIMANLQEQGFHVWGFFATENDLNYQVGEKYLDNILVTYSNSNWVTSETYYWPGKGKELDIYAISSWDEDYSLLYSGSGDSQACNVDIDHNANKVTITEFDVDEDADNDLMVAAMIKQDQDDDKYVRPNFEHALTKVLLKFRGPVKTSDTDETEIYVVSAETSSIPSKSTLTVTNIPNTGTTTTTYSYNGEDYTGEVVEVEGKHYRKEDTMTSESGTTVNENATALVVTTSTTESTGYSQTFLWGAQSDNTTYVAQNELAQVKLAAGDVILETGNKNTEIIQAVKLTDEYQLFGSWLLLPQGKSTEQAAYAEMTKDTHYLDVVYIVAGQEIKQRFDLTNGGNIKAWERNQQITYNVTISPDYINFEPDVTDWITSKEENHFN